MTLLKDATTMFQLLNCKTLRQHLVFLRINFQRVESCKESGAQLFPVLKKMLNLTCWSFFLCVCLFLTYKVAWRTVHVCSVYLTLQLWSLFSVLRLQSFRQLVVQRRRCMFLTGLFVFSLKNTSRRLSSQLNDQKYILNTGVLLQRSTVGTITGTQITRTADRLIRSKFPKTSTTESLKLYLLSKKFNYIFWKMYLKMNV